MTYFVDLIFQVILIKFILLIDTWRHVVMCECVIILITIFIKVLLVQLQTTLEYILDMYKC